MRCQTAIAASVLALCAALYGAATGATELIYTPVNPAFGGNPLNGSVLLNNAQAQNDTTDPDLEGRQDKSPLEQLNDTLQRLVVSRIAAAAASGVVNNTGGLIPGTVETSDFIITIVAIPNTNRLEVTTFEKLTGQSTSFEVVGAAQ